MATLRVTASKDIATESEAPGIRALNPFDFAAGIMMDSGAPGVSKCSTYSCGVGSVFSDADMIGSSLVPGSGAVHIEMGVPRVLLQANANMTGEQDLTTLTEATGCSVLGCTSSSSGEGARGSFLTNSVGSNARNEPALTAVPGESLLTTKMLEWRWYGSEHIHTSTSLE